MKTGTVEAVTLLNHYEDGLDYCKIRIDFDDMFIFGKYNDLLGFIGKCVEFDTRKDCVAGQVITVVANLVNQYTVQAIDKLDEIRLYSEHDNERAVCTLDIKSLRMGDIEYGAVALLYDYEVGQSPRTKWLDCKMLDKNSKQFVLRIFVKNIEGDKDPEDIIQALVGHYIKFDVSFTKYGYQTDEVTLVNVPVVAAPEVDIAISVITNAIADDPELQQYVSAFDIINVLKGQFDGDLGYSLVFIAAEISLIRAIENMSSAYNTKAMIRAAIATRGYLLPSKTKFSKSVLNFNKLVRTPLKDDEELRLIIDPMAREDASPTKRLYYKLRVLAKDIINERRDINEETDYIDTMSNLHDQFGGLL